MLNSRHNIRVHRLLIHEFNGNIWAYVGTEMKVWVSDVEWVDQNHFLGVKKGARENELEVYLNVGEKLSGN